MSLCFCACVRLTHPPPPSLAASVRLCMAGLNERGRARKASQTSFLIAAAQKTLVCAHVCVRACVRACVCSCVRVCVRVCVRACMRACVRACVGMCVHSCMCLGESERGGGLQVQRGDGGLDSVTTVSPVAEWQDLPHHGGLNWGLQSGRTNNIVGAFPTPLPLSLSAFLSLIPSLLSISLVLSLPPHFHPPRSRSLPDAISLVRWSRMKKG